MGKRGSASSAASVASLAEDTQSNSSRKSVPTPTKTENGAKIPKAILELQARFAAEGKSITPESVGDLPIELRRKAFAALRYEYSSKEGKEKAEDFNKKGDKEKRDVLCSFLIDPNMGRRNVKNQNSFEKEKTSVDSTEWCTVEELAAPGRCNGIESAKMYAEDAVSRLHIRPAFASRNIMQYQYTREEQVKKNSNKETVQLDAEADMEQEDYKMVKDALEKVDPETQSKGTPFVVNLADLSIKAEPEPAKPVPAKRRRSAKQDISPKALAAADGTEESTAEDAKATALTEEKTAKATLERSITAEVQKMRAQLEEVAVIKQRLCKKASFVRANGPDPEKSSMVVFLTNETQATFLVLDQFQNVFVDFKALDVTAANVEDCAIQRSATNTAFISLKDAHRRFCTDVLADFLKMVK